ncbi:metal-sensitive transcriptional regulator [Alphaproteobacteria bacterium]|nr:metal-sensitive transcriptional regulator [Alphaproteobacteria bacterium]
MSNPDHIKNLHRINRIIGQLKGVEKMIVEKKYCMDILQQTRAVSSAIKSLENNILNKHIDHCVKDAIKKNNKDKNEKISEIQDLLKKINS